MMKTLLYLLLLLWTSTSLAQAERPKLIASGKTDICVGESVIFSLGGQYVWYNWNTGSKAPETEIRGERPGAVRVFCTVINREGETQFSDTITVNVFARPTPPAIAYSPSEQLLEAASADAVQWYYRDGFGRDSLIPGAVSRFYRPQLAGYYFAEAQNEAGCTNRSSVIYVCFRPRVRLIGNPSLCVGSRAILHISDHFPNYLWSNGETTQSIVFEATRPGTFNLYCRVQSAECFVRSDTVELRVFAKPQQPIVIYDSVQKHLATQSRGTYAWFKGRNVGVDTVQALNQDSIFIPTESGYYFVVVRNGWGCASASEPMYVRVIPNGIADALQHQHLAVYPNPNDGTFSIESNEQLSNTASIQLYDFTGKQIHQELLTDTPIRLSNFVPGIYQLIVSDEKNVYRTKIIIR
jgi:hypothetical protein